MPRPVAISAIAELRERIRHLEGPAHRARRVLPFGLAAIDDRLPGGGLALGGLHEVADGAGGAADGAAAALFAAGIAARTRGRVLWAVTRQDLFAPALAQAGLAAERVVFVEAGDEKTLLACFEEGLRHGGLGAVVGEAAHLSMTASRRLQLAAERSGAIGIAIRRRRRGAESDIDAFGQPTASVTRWRVSALPSAPLPVPGIGRTRWRLALVRCRGGEGFDIDVEVRDEGRIALPAEVADRPPQADVDRRLRGGKGAPA